MVPGPLADDDRGQFRDEDDRHARDHEGDQDVADGPVEARGDDDLDGQKEQSGDRDRAADATAADREQDTRAAGREREPRPGVIAQRGAAVGRGAPGKVVRIAEPAGEGDDDAGRQREDEERVAGFGQRRRPDHRGVPRGEPERDAPDSDQRDRGHAGRRQRRADGGPEFGMLRDGHERLERTAGTAQKSGKATTA